MALSKDDEKVRQNFEYADKLFKVHRKIWDEEWSAAKNPFVAFAEYKKARPKRKVIYDQWDAANEAWELVKPKKT